MIYCSHCAFSSGLPFDVCPRCGWQEPAEDDGPVTLGDLEGAPAAGLTTRTPWDALAGDRVPYGAVLLVSAYAGTGKTLLLLGLGDAWAQAGGVAYIGSYEMGVDRLVSSARWVGPRFGAGVIPYDGPWPWDLSCPRRALVIVDSLSQLGGRDDLSVVEVAERCRAWAREHDHTVALISHVTKDGDAAGPEKIRHACDIEIEITTAHAQTPTHDIEYRVVTVGPKNRFGPASTFRLDWPPTEWRIRDEKAPAFEPRARRRVPRGPR